MISVIVPVYNVDKVLHYCIDSILNQSYSDFELLLINDGSTDKSGDICDKYSKIDTRIRVVHTENGGVSKARNKGIELAKGEHICFIDSDDYISETYLEELLNAKKDYPDYDNVWCGFQTVDGYNIPNTIQTALYSQEDLVSFSSTKCIMEIHSKWLDAGPVCKLYSRQVVLNENIRFEEGLSLGEDLVFNFRYLDCTNGKIVVINKSLYNYTMVSTDTLSSKYYDNLFEIYSYINSVMYNHLVCWDCEEDQFEMFYNSRYFCYDNFLKNTFHPKSTIKNKYRFNNKFLKSSDFCEALSKTTCYINPIIRLAYKIHFYQLVTVVEFIVKMKSRLFEG